MDGFFGRGPAQGGDTAAAPPGNDDWLLRMSDTVAVPEVVPWPDEAGGNKTAAARNAEQIKINRMRAAMTLTTPEDQGHMLNARLRAAAGDPGGIMSRDPLAFGNGQVVSGGIVNQLGGLGYGTNAQVGSSRLVGGGNSDAEIPVIGMSHSHAHQDVFEQLSDEINIQLRLDPNLYTGPNGLAPYALVSYDTGSVEWDEYYYDSSIINVVAERAPTRTAGFTRRKFSRGLVRYGAGVDNTVDFLESAFGRKMFNLQVKQMVTSIQDSNNFAVIYSYLEAVDIGKRVLRAFATNRNPDDMLRILEDGKRWWHILAFYPGIERYIEWIKRTMGRYGGSMDTVIMSAHAAANLVLESPERNQAYIAGEAAVLTAHEDYEGAVARLAGSSTRIIKTKSFAMDHQTAIDPLETEMQIGQFHLMLDPNDASASTDEKFLRGSCTNVRILDATADDDATITFAQGIENCGVWAQSPASFEDKEAVVGGKYATTFYDTDGKPWKTLGPLLYEACKGHPRRWRKFGMSMMHALKRVVGETLYNTEVVKNLTDVTLVAHSFTDLATLAGPAGFELTKTSAKTNPLVIREANGTGMNTNIRTGETASADEIAIINAAREEVAGMFKSKNDPILKGLSLLLTLDFTQEAMLHLASLDVMLPFTILLARPYNTYMTSTIIATKMGSETAQTFVTPGRFIPNVDGNTHVSTGSFIYKMKAVVKRPKDVFVGHGASVVDYIGGENVKFIELPTTGRSNFNPSVHKFGNYGGKAPPPRSDSSYRRSAPSMHALMVPYGWAHKPETSSKPITLHKTLHVNYGAMLSAVKVPASEDYGFPSFAWYNHWFEWTHKIVPSPDPYAEHIRLVNQVSPSNPVMWRGRTVRYDAMSQRFTKDSDVTVPATHWGSDLRMSGPGCMNARVGIATKSRLGM